MWSTLQADYASSVGRDSVDATGWTLRGSNPGWRRDFSHPSTPALGPHPAPYIAGTGSFPGIKRRGRGVKHPTLPKVEVKERVQLYTYSSSATSWPVLGWALPVPSLVQCTLPWSSGQGTASNSLLWGPTRWGTLGEKYEYNVRYDITVCSRAVNGRWDQDTLKMETVVSETSAPTCQTKCCNHETTTWAFKWSDFE